MTHETKNPQDNIEAFIDERKSWLDEAARIVGGEGATPSEVFSPPTEVRADASELDDLSAETEAQLREIAGRFGLGGEQDIMTGADVDIIEGGKPWKVLAESAISSPTKLKVFAGSPYRKIGTDEAEFMQEKYGDTVGEITTEYDMIRLIAGELDGFTPLDKEEVLPFGYDIDNEFAVSQESTGQLVRIGTMDQPGGGVTDVVVLRIDRDEYIDEAGDSKYRNQPNSAQVMGIISDVLTAVGDEESAIGMVTSSTYPSRAIDAVRVGRQHERDFRTGMYGRQTLADVKGEPVAKPTELKQIPGELHVLAVKLEELTEEVSK